MACIVSQAIDCTIKDVTILYGYLYSLGHENV